ncbi:NAD-P-binding protein [Sparassis latifolia]
MPAITPGTGKVLVTGANGYIAIWVVRRLLEQGYAVRGTVRSHSKSKHLYETFKSYGNKLEIIIVEDITKEGAFDEAVKGVVAIEHTASPFHFNAAEPNDVIVPAVSGTLSVLQSALKYGSAVKRVVVTSSCAAVLTALPEPHVFTELDWNNKSVKEVEEKGRNAAGSDKYMASKTLAERAAWDFIAKNKAQLSWDLVVLNPPYVFGPILHAIGQREQLNTSMHELFFAVFEGAKDKATLATGSSWVDVRDLADAHVLALVKAEAGGERIIISGGAYNWQDWVIAARKLEPSTPAGNESYKPEEAVYVTNYNTAKAAKLLGLQYHTLEESTRDMIADFKARGWLK